MFSMGKDLLDKSPYNCLGVYGLLIRSINCSSQFKGKASVNDSETQCFLFICKELERGITLLIRFYAKDLDI